MNYNDGMHACLDRGGAVTDYELRCSCSRCDARPGEPCRTWAGLKTTYHADRMRRGTELYFREHPERRPSS